MTDSIEVRVARGVALLDRTLADWDERIDLKRLDLGSGCSCILGQEFADHPEVLDDGWDLNGYEIGVSELLGDEAGQAWRYGFDRRTDGEFYADLTAEWKRVILSRRGGAS